MRASEFLRSLADTLAALEGGVDAPAGFSGTDNEPTDDNVGEFTPPLQAKIELLKKSSNVKSVYDNTSDGVGTNQNPNIFKHEAAEDDGPFE